ncbi:flagellar hook-length control protein FliK [Succinivibrio dextrinosolvens]|uniref:flagellar hook-length control protein FliK n=1 Tax=Succinivibrio dextrinosolvens TaxID=83771 RepID=UPI00241C5215|nr:flagellar hook-length control protein FliK [Succinivibrio dextrinosolvens]MBE6422472.1 hypothetical protein [Succinivibrio dextrinosolvens]
MDNLDIEVKSSEKVQSEVSLSENENKAVKEPARINTQATANYISLMSRQKGLLAESSQRTYNQLSSSLNTYVQDPQSVKDIEADKDSASLGHYRKLTVQVINRDPSLQEKVAQDLSSAKEMVRSRDAASTLEQNMKQLPEALSEGVPAGKNLSKLICQSVVNLTDYENMGAGLQRDLAIREVYPPQSELSLRSKIATSDALSASIAYVKSNQPEVLEKLEPDQPVEKPKPGTSTPQIMTRYLRKALDEFPEGSTYLDIFKQNRQKAEKVEGEAEYNDEISKNTAKRIHDLIHKAADTARKGNLIPAAAKTAAAETAAAETAAGTVADDSAKAAEGKPRDASTLSLSELSARAAKLQQQFREERIRLAAEGKLPDPAVRQSLANVDEQALRKADAAIEQKMAQTKAAAAETQTKAQSELRAAQSETLKTETPKTETLAPKTEQIKAEQVKAEQVKAEQVKAQVQEPVKEQVKSETPAPKSEQIKAEVQAPKTDTAKTQIAPSEVKTATSAAQSQLSADDIRKLAMEAVKEALKESVKTQIEVTQTSAKAAASEVVNELKAQLEASQNNAREMASMVKEALALKAQSTPSEFQGTPVKVSYSTNMGAYGYSGSSLFDLSSFHKAQRIADESLVQDFTSQATQNRVSMQQEQLENEASQKIPDETDKVTTAELLRPRVNADGSEIEEPVQNEEELVQNLNQQTQPSENEDAQVNTQAPVQAESVALAENTEPVVNVQAKQVQTVQTSQPEQSAQTQAPQADPNLNRLYSQISSEAQSRILNASAEQAAPVPEQNTAPLQQEQTASTGENVQPDRVQKDIYVEVEGQRSHEEVLVQNDNPQRQTQSAEQTSLQQNQGAPVAEAHEAPVQNEPAYTQNLQQVNEPQLKQNTAATLYQNIAQAQMPQSVEQPQNIYVNLPELHQNTVETQQELPELRQNDNVETTKVQTDEPKQTQNIHEMKQTDGEVLKKDAQIIITRSNPSSPSADAQIEASKAEQMAAQNAQRQAALTQGGNATQSTVQNTVTNMTEQVLVTRSGTVISQPQPQIQTQAPAATQGVGLNQNMTIAQAQAMTAAIDEAEAEETAKAIAQAQAQAQAQNQGQDVEQSQTQNTANTANAQNTAEASDKNGLLDLEAESTNPVPNPFATSFSTISGVGVTAGADAVSETAYTNTAQTNSGVTLEQQAQMHSRIVAAQNMDDVAADDTPISNPDNDIFEEILDPEKKGINSDLKSAVQNRPSFLSGLSAGLGNNPETVLNNQAANPNQNMQTKVLTETVPEDELDEGVVPKDVKAVDKTKVAAVTQGAEASDDFKINAVPSKTPGAAAITNGRSEPIPDPTVVDDVGEIKEKSGFFSKLASIFSKKPESAGETQNLQLNTASASAALMAQNVAKDSPLDAYTYALKAQINNQALPQVVRDQAKEFLKKLESPINDLPSVTNWLSFTSSPLSTSSSMSLALHQWAFLLLSIRFSQLGKSVDKFLRKDVDLMEDRFDDELKKISKELGSGSRGTISSLIDDTFEQISRMQKPLKENLPALFQYIPLPPAYDGGKEGAFNARPVVEEDGKKSWHLTFVFDLKGIGPIEIKAVAKLPELKLSVIASSVEGLQKVQEALPMLKEQLQEAGITTRSAMARLGNVHIQDTVASPDVENHERNSDGATLSVNI